MRNVKTTFSTFTTLTTASISLLVAAGLLSACNSRDDNRTVGTKIDDAVQTAERKTEDVQAQAQAAGKEIKVAAANAADDAALKARDMTITTQVNAQLTRDASLSALSINVDTSAGQVLLKGTAPDTAARDRATELAKAVEGVVGVTNTLTIKPAN